MNSIQDDHADDEVLDKQVAFADGVTLERGRIYDHYRGTPQACIAAALIRPEQVPGSPGHPRKMHATYFDGVPVGKGVYRDRSEKFMSVRVCGRQLEILCGLEKSIAEQRDKLFWAKVKADREREQKVRLMAMAAEHELGRICTDIQEYRQRLVNELREQFRRVRNGHLLVHNQGFIFSESAIETLDDLLDDMIGVVMEADIQHDIGVRQAREQELKAAIAAADPRFQRSLRTLTKTVSTMTEGSTQ